MLKVSGKTTIHRFVCWLVLGLWLGTSTVRAAGIALTAERQAHIAGLSTIVGEPVGPQGLTGKPVVVSFFASWCPPCRVEFSHLNHLFEAYGAENITVVAINVYEEFDENDAVRMQKFLSDTQPKFHVVKGTDESIASFLPVERIPTVYVFDRKGQPRLHFIHKVGASKRNPGLEELQTAVRAALAGQ